MRKPAIVLLLLLLILSWSYAGSPQGRLYAVMAGVSKYKNPGNDLPHPRADATEIYDILKLRTEISGLRLLTDEKATVSNILKTTRELFSQTKPEDSVLFFFSGHGNNELFSAYDAPLKFDQLRAIFKETKAKRKIIFADSCHAGTFRTAGSARTGQRPSLGGDVMLFLSSRSNQNSLDNPRMKYSMFTYFLAAGLKGGADANRDRIITARELFDFVNPKVKERSNGVQIPVMWGKFPDNMTILDWNPAN
jgi:uncharacterized caspase-like protein